MRRCNYVELCDAFHHKLEPIGERPSKKFRLKEISGIITSCESNNKELIIKLHNKFNSESTKNKKIICDFKNFRDIPAVCGQKLKCFYEETYQWGDIEEIRIDACELSEDEDSTSVIRIGIKSIKYKFIEFE